MRKRVWNRAPVGTPKQHQQPITQGSKHMCGISLCGMPTVFAKGHIAHMMHWILNRPMPAPQPFNCCRPSLVRFHTHQSIRHLTRAFASLEDDPLTFASHDEARTSGQSRSSICALLHLKL